MLRTQHIVQCSPTSINELNRHIAFHEAGHVTAIYIRNKQQQLPPVFFQITINKSRQEAIITWVAFQEQIFRLTSINKNLAETNRRDIKKSIATFHQLTTKEKAKIQQQRLRIISARTGESIPALLKRVGSKWDKESCAVANNLQPDDSLKKGQLIKVVISEPFKYGSTEITR